jgi:hypothetical protein
MLPRLIVLNQIPDPPTGAVTATHWMAFLGRVPHRPNGITLSIAREVFGGPDGEPGRKEMAALLKPYDCAVPSQRESQAGYRMRPGQTLAPILVLRAYERAHARLVDAYENHAWPPDASARAEARRAGRALAPALEELPESIEQERQWNRGWIAPHHLLLTWLSDVYALGGSGEALFYAIAKQLLLRSL